MDVWENATEIEPQHIVSTEDRPPRDDSEWFGSIVRQERLRDVNSMFGYPDDADAFEKFREDPHASAKFHSMAEALRRALCRASNKAVLNLFP